MNVLWAKTDCTLIHSLHALLFRIESQYLMGYKKDIKIYTMTDCVALKTNKLT